MKILGIDPGNTLGFCLVDKRENSFEKVAVGEIRAADTEKFHQWLDLWATIDGLRIVVCEDFIARPEYTDGRWTKLDTAKQVGSIERTAHNLGCIFVEIQPAMKPDGYRAAKLKYIKGKKGTHKEDATAHAYYVAKLGYLPSWRKF